MLNVDRWIAWAQPIASRLGWRRRELEAIEHPSELYDAIRGAEWRHLEREDELARMVLPILHGNGVKKTDGSPIVLADLLGREPVRLVDAMPLTEAEQERADLLEEERAIKAEQARWMLYQVSVERAKREGHGPEVVS